MRLWLLYLYILYVYMYMYMYRMCFFHLKAVSVSRRKTTCARDIAFQLEHLDFWNPSLRGFHMIGSIVYVWE